MSKNSGSNSYSSYNDYSDEYSDDSDSSGASSSANKDKPAPAFTFANIPAEVSLALGEYCTVRLKPGKTQYVVEVSTNYPREIPNKVQLTIGEYGCSVTQAENTVRSSVIQQPPVTMPAPGPLALSASQQPDKEVAAESTLIDEPEQPLPPQQRKNPRDFYRAGNN